MKDLCVIFVDGSIGFIETCFHERKKYRRRHCPNGASVPDLYDRNTGDVFDYKTGSDKTRYNRHIKTVSNVAKPRSKLVTTHDVTPAGVTKRYSTKLV